MTPAVPDVLARIVDRKRLEVAEKAKLRRGLEQNADFQTAQRRDFRGALTANPPAIIAEIKKASPSKGLLAPDFNPSVQARQYLSGGAAALSVLTDKDFFQGALSDLRIARSVAPLPTLRKDFTIDEIDVIEAAAAGADAVLLIAAILSREQIEAFSRLAAHYRMAALVEVHDDSDLDKALQSNAAIIGVNNRDLRTFDVSLDTSIRLAERIPAHCVRVAESGIFSNNDVRRLMDAGFHAFLVGERLMKAADPSASLRELRGA